MNSLIIIIMLIVLSLFIIILFRIKFELSQIKLVNYQIKNNKNSKELKFIYLSDLHQKFNEEYLNKIFNYVKNIDYEYVLVCGDLINYKEIIKEDHFDNIINNLIKFFNIFDNKKILYAFGNHELKLKDDTKLYNKFINKLKTLNNLTILDDNYITIDDRINIYGFSLFKGYYIKRLLKKKIIINFDIINSHLNNLDNNKYNIVLSHNPNYNEELINYGFDLVLSAHSHGGLIRLPILGAIVSPDLNLFPKYSKGLYEYNNKFIITSNGLGEHTYKIRLNNIHELYNVKLTGV